MTDIDDMLDDDATPATEGKKTKRVGVDKKPGKVKVTKPAAKGKVAAKADKPAKTGKADKPAAKGKVAAKADKPAKTAKVASDVEMTQPKDDVTIKVIRKLKEPTMASKIAADMGVHRRAIRAQLQRLAKEKGSGITMKKVGFNWMVTNTLK